MALFALVFAPAFAGGFSATGAINDPDIDELSGMVPSLAHPGLFWGVNDSGNAPRLFAFDGSGKVLERVEVDGARNRDWEDLGWLDVDGRRTLVIADIGDNFGWRRDPTLYFVTEPRAGAEHVAPHRIVHFTYADGPHDAETLAVDVGARQILIVEKRAAGAGLYSLPLDAPDGSIARRVATLPAPWPETDAPWSLAMLRGGATSMDIAPDGKSLALLTYTHLLLYRRHGSWARTLLAPPARWERLPLIAGLESVCFDGNDVVVAPEGRPAPIFRLALRPPP